MEVCDDLISRKAAIKLAIDLDYESRGILKESRCREIENRYNMIPPAQPEDWMERNKERILQAGMKGQEVEFRIGGRLFAIRKKAQ